MVIGEFLAGNIFSSCSNLFILAYFLIMAPFVIVIVVIIVVVVVVIIVVIVVVVIVVIVFNVNF